MTAYDNDPRVTVLGASEFTVRLVNGDLVDVVRDAASPAHRDWWSRRPRKGAVADWPDDGLPGLPECDRQLLVFPAADEAIRSLIGEPQ